ncbi:MAG: DNA polymerase III subunit gamma/tau [Candidatus Zixiibacteriota bacterium]|nr:MAG: DNA polymerase III subunit gamma/tau [candidate division Zixibacteria bacterium]
MAYQVFARKYRPQTFEDIVAQEHVTRTLQNAVKNNRVGSGYLFCGPRGTGKTTTARVLAKCLNCVDGPTPTPCGECSACSEIASGSSLDVLEIDAASNTGVDDVRTLRENVRYLPTSGKKRIFIIDEVHRLSDAAFDALLKTLEEPPDHVVFVFATTEPMKVPETILSRTQRFDFKRVSSTDLVKHLKKIAEKEKLLIDNASLVLLARKADGSVRDCLSLLDQVVAYAGESVSQQQIVEALGLVDQQTLFDFTAAVAAQDTPQVLQLVRQIENTGTDPDDFINELLDHFRILMILGTDKNVKDQLDLNKDEIEEYLKQSAFFSTGDIVRLMNTAARLLIDLRSGLDERLVLETGAVKMASMESTVRFEEILAFLRENPKTSSTLDLMTPNTTTKKVRTTSAPLSFVKGAESHTSNETEYTQSLNMPQLQAGWEGFIAALKQKSHMLASQLGMAEIGEVVNNKIKLIFGANVAASVQVIQKPDNLNLILQTFRDHFRARVSLDCEVDPDRESRPPGAAPEKKPKVDINKLIENSPRIRSLLEKVNGEIIGVKKIDEKQK